METRIINKNKVLPETQAKSLENTLNDKAKKLDKIFKNYPKPVMLEVHISDEERNQYQMSMMINMKSKPVYVHDSGENVVSLVEGLIDKLKKAVLKQKSFERKEYLYKRKERQNYRIGDMIASLDKFREEQDKASFVNMFKNAIPNIKKYIMRRIAQAQITTAIKPKAFNVQELVDELYLRIYEKFYQRPENQDAIVQWIYREAEALLDEKFEELQFEGENLEKIDELLDVESETLRERYNVDAEGDLMMYEEFDDPSYQDNTYDYEDILSNDPETRDKINELLSREELDRMINLSMAKLPVYKRTVFDLHIFEKLEADDIAAIKNTSETEINKVVEEVNDYIREDIARAMNVDKEEQV